MFLKTFLFCTLIHIILIVQCKNNINRPPHINNRLKYAAESTLPGRLGLSQLNKSNSSIIPHTPGVKEVRGESLHSFNHYGEVLLERQILREYLEEIVRDIELTHLTSNCRTSIDALIDGLYNIEDWAWEIFDSNGKPESGLKDGNMFWEGRFSQCNRVNHAVDNQLPIQGRYFRVSVQGRFRDDNQKFHIRIGTCFPGICSSEDITNLLTNTSGFLSIPETIFADNLSYNLTAVRIDTEKHFWQDYVAISAAATLVLTIMLCMLATLIDCIEQRQRLKSAEKQDGDHHNHHQPNTTAVSDSRQPLMTSQTPHNYNTVTQTP